MPKRKAAQVVDKAAEPSLRRSTRRKSSALEAATVPADNDAGKKVKTEVIEEKKTSKAAKAAKTSAGAARKRSKETPKANGKSTSSTSKADANHTTGSSEKSYWLLKAEPESRFENGIDVKFSIDDLAAKMEPEPWDGIRNYVARNNLRAMKKGDLAFFYHSNCKEPGLVGIMEIVQEHSPDLSAHDPKAPYYDASSKPAEPKWSVVHVEFRSKFVQSIGLKELREMGKPGSPLENMQMLKQSRLSVSRVNPAEWEYLMGVVEERGGLSKKA